MGMRYPKIEQHRFVPDSGSTGEEYVRDLTEKSVREITRVSSPVAIYLQGSFGRGEGTVLYDDEGQPRLWRDLDLVVIYPFRESPEILSTIRERLNDSDSLDQGETPVDSSYISIAQLPRPVALRWRDLKMYELATNSLHVYGKDIRPDMAVQDGQIPLESGERFLLQKCMGLCKSYPYVDIDPAISNYEVSKTYIEISSALALKEGQPSADFEERLETLGASGNSAIASLVPRIEEWGAYKTHGEFEPLRELPPEESWNQARDDLLRTLAIFHELQEDQLYTDSEAWLQAYYSNLTERFLANTFSSAIAPDWPPGKLIASLGKLGSLFYRSYGTLVISNGTPTRLSCPLSAVYVASMAGLLTLGTEKWYPDGVTWIRTYLNIAGENLESDDPHEWISDLDQAYKRAAKPLYGMG